MFLSFSEFNDPYRPTKVLEQSFQDRLHVRTLKTKKVLIVFFFTAKSENFLFEFYTYQFCV